MTDALIRAGRTFLQTFIGIYLAGLVSSDTFEGLADLGLLEAAASGAIVAVISFVQNLLEDTASVDYNKG